jgi:NADPH-dependent glutamate synthase beta subunit-like oxidoreductase
VSAVCRRPISFFDGAAGWRKTWPATLVLLALGFLGPERGGMLDRLGVTLDARGNVETVSPLRVPREELSRWFGRTGWRRQ